MPLSRLQVSAQRIAQGDLSEPLRRTGSRSELGQLGDAMAGMQAALRNLVQQVRDSSESIRVASPEVASGNTDLSHRTETSASKLQKTASSVQALAGTVRQSTDTASEANRMASHAHEVARAGGQAVSGVIEAMGGIQASSRKTADISVASREQSASLDLVNLSVGALDQSTQQNAALVEQGAAAAESLKEQAERLHGLVVGYRV